MVNFTLSEEDEPPSEDYDSSVEEGEEEISSLEMCLDGIVEERDHLQRDYHPLLLDEREWDYSIFECYSLAGALESSLPLVNGGEGSLPELQQPLAAPPGIDYLDLVIGYALGTVGISGEETLTPLTESDDDPDKILKILRSKQREGEASSATAIYFRSIQLAA